MIIVCSRCGRNARPSPTGLCGHCNTKKRCRICQKVVPKTGSQWCDECHNALFMAGHMAKMIGNRPPPELLTVLESYYQSRASSKLPLFSDPVGRWTAIKELERTRSGV